MSSLPSAHPAAAALDALRARALKRSRLRSRTAWALSYASVDAAMLCAAVAATLLGSRGSDVPVLPAAWLVCFGVLVAGLSWFRGAYEPRLRLELLDDLRGLIAVTSL